jgi:carbohydrate kinase (thermoresistant glucokinase family)
MRRPLNPQPVIVVVMGVSGSGKTTVAALLAAALGCRFEEGDNLHPPANVEKMHRGTPLTDKTPISAPTAQTLISRQRRGRIVVTGITFM